MAVRRTYRCSRHGQFDGWEAICPRGCVDGIKMMLSAPALVSDRTKGADKTLKGLASDFGMTNIASVREGEGQQKVAQQHNAYPNAGAAIWGGDARYNMASVMGGAIRSVRGEAVGVKPGDVGQLQNPKASSYIADHENLRIQQ